MLYGRLDDLREQTSRRLARVLLETGGTPQARTERDSLTQHYIEDLAQYDAAENGLCFGRLDLRERRSRSHIGRIGIFDEDDDYETAAAGLARARGPPLLPRHRRLARRRDPPPAHPHAQPQPWSA